ncbi:conserved domain protein [Bacteroides clarus YIT 12056]|uniref:Conserved domain protein n=1 Tax=Bacteroides clarus YIT 12056 TaxID=762984 RepID=A0ABN0CSC5_9BACE|nr:conserved domain protein [Bacteroides clarus YIT 12056]
MQLEASRNRRRVKYSFSCSVFKIIADRKAKSVPSGQEGITQGGVSEIGHSPCSFADG